MARNPKGKRSGFKRKGPQMRKGPLRSAIKNVVKSVLNKKSETKMTNLYGGVSSPGVPALYPGNAQAFNARIFTNATDINFILPPVFQGIDDWNRIGTKTQPVSLRLNMKISINPVYINTSSPVQRNLVAVLYVLEHKVLKDYISLVNLNNFTQLLDTGNGNTNAFYGSPTDVDMPIAKQFYKLCVKKVIPLRCDGAWIGGTIASPGQVSNGNSDSWSKSLSLNLTKFLPKTLTYPETISGSATPSTLYPTNCGLFWSVGFYNMDLQYTAPPGVPSSDIQVQYNSVLAFKDM